MTPALNIAVVHVCRRAEIKLPEVRLSSKLETGVFYFWRNCHSIYNQIHLVNINCHYKKQLAIRRARVRKDHVRSH